MIKTSPFLLIFCLFNYNYASLNTTDPEINARIIKKMIPHSINSSADLTILIKNFANLATENRALNAIFNDEDLVIKLAKKIANRTNLSPDDILDLIITLEHKDANQSIINLLYVVRDNIKTNNVFTQAIKSNNTRDAKALLKMVNPNILIDNNPALLIAAKNNNEELVKLLLNKGAKSNRKGKIYTPLMVANDKISALLLEKGANIEATTKEGKTALYIATTQGDLNKVKYLLKQGANNNVKDSMGTTPLLALLNEPTENKLAITKELLSYGADINAQDKEGNTPLILAVSHDDPTLTNLMSSVC